MYKKGIIEVQFNWIFVLVVGAIILVFFFGFVQKQKSFAEDKNAARFMNDMEAILVGAQVSKESAFPINIPRLPIEFKCDDACLCTYGVGGVTQNYKGINIFAPDPLEGTQMILWSKEWKFPFRVTNFIFGGSERTKYYIVYDNTQQSNQWKNVLEKNFPVNFDIEWVNMNSDLGKIQFNNYPFTKILVLDKTNIPTNFIQNMNLIFDGEYLNVVMITGSDLIFYDKNIPTEDLHVRPAQHYFDEMGIYGALFSKDSQMYICNMKSALARWVQVAEVIKGRMEQLDKEGTVAQCNYNIDDIIIGPGDYYGLKNMEQSIQSILSSDIITSGGSLLSTSMGDFRRENQLKIQSNCPSMY